MNFIYVFSHTSADVGDGLKNGIQAGDVQIIEAETGKRSRTHTVLEGIQESENEEFETEGDTDDIQGKV